MIDFGKIKTTTWPPRQTRLTKQIRQFGFKVDTKLDTPQVRDIIADTVQNYPMGGTRLDHGVFLMNTPRPAVQNMIGWAHRTVNTEGRAHYTRITWGLMLVDHDGQRALRLARMITTNGAIGAVKEMETFLNELEADLRIKDPDASITLAVPVSA